MRIVVWGLWYEDWDADRKCGCHVDELLFHEVEVG